MWKTNYDDDDDDNDSDDNNINNNNNNNNYYYYYYYYYRGKMFQIMVLLTIKLSLKSFTTYLLSHQKSNVYVDLNSMKILLYHWPPN